MNMATRKNIFATHLPAYRSASKPAKGGLITAVAQVTGLHRKAVIRRFNTLTRRRATWVDRRGGQSRYGPAVTRALKVVWHLAGEICAERLYGQVPEYIRQCQRAGAWPFNQAITRALRVMSQGTLKRRLANFEGQLLRRALSATKPSAIKELVPVRHGPWLNPSPGYGEIDTVAHCGLSVAGDFAYTVQYTDVATTWTGLRAQLNKGEAATLASIALIQRRLPFELLGLDPDSGTEFLNWHLVRWAEDQGVTLTRTRPYLKNDHARIEQKNYVNVRRFVGYARYATPEAVAALNELYVVLEDYLNFFVPSMKCTAKVKLPNGRTKRTYDAPQTAYARVLGSPHVAENIKAQLKLKHDALLMVELKRKIDATLKKLKMMRG